MGSASRRMGHMFGNCSATVFRVGECLRRFVLVQRFKGRRPETGLVLVSMQTRKRQKHERDRKGRLDTCDDCNVFGITLQNCKRMLVDGLVYGIRMISHDTVFACLLFGLSIPCH